jgi:cysteine-rich repeat protein
MRYVKWWCLPLSILLGGIMCTAALFAVHADDVSTHLKITICGDGLVDTGETCDDGPGGNNGAYGSSTAERKCNSDCTAFGPYCGDDILQVRFMEECDDGNNTSGDICDAQCKEEEPSPPGGGGSPTVGSTPSIPAPSGNILSQTETKVVLRGKAYPNRVVNILLDGKAIGTVNADANADFLYSTTAVTPGTATFGFWSEDQAGTDSLTTSVVFEVVQSAITTVANIFIPPTVNVSDRQVTPGSLLTLSGLTVPNAQVNTQIDKDTKLDATAEATGAWALQLDTASLGNGFHTAKSLFEVTGGSAKSGYGRAVSFYIGQGTPEGGISPDINEDGKVNLVDFSIFLLSWGTDDIRSDFNVDGKVNLADFSIMLFAWTG